MSKLNEIIACTLGKDPYNTYEDNFSGLTFNSTEEDLDSLEELLKDF